MSQSYDAIECSQSGASNLSSAPKTDSFLRGHITVGRPAALRLGRPMSQRNYPANTPLSCIRILVNTPNYVFALR